MGYKKLPSDEELFPRLGQGSSLHDDYIVEAEKLRPAAAIPNMNIKDRADYGVFLEKLGEQNGSFCRTMERWLVERLLRGGVVDSFPPEKYTLVSFSVEKTGITTTYDPYYDSEEESAWKDKDDLNIGVQYFSYLTETMYLFEKEEKEGKRLDNGTMVYRIMKPIYQAVHMGTVGQALKKLFSPIIFTAVCLLLAWGSKFLSDATVENPFISVPIVLIGLGLILAAVCGGIWIIVRIFGFFKSLGKILSRPKLLKQAASNASQAYRLLRYYRLWEKEIGKSQHGIALMDKYLYAYLAKYPIRSWEGKV